MQFSYVAVLTAQQKCQSLLLMVNTVFSVGKEAMWLRERGGLIFECFDTPLRSTPTLHKDAHH